MKVLIIAEQWWPDGTGGILASHLIARLLRVAGFNLTVVHGTKDPVKVDGINYAYTRLLGVRDKHRLWINCLALTKQSWFLKIMNENDVVYIPRYCYPIIPMAKRLRKKVVVHLHDYQPVSYNATIPSEEIKACPSLSDLVKFEIYEHGSIIRALGTITAPVNKLCRLWLREADAIICVSQRQAELISKLAPELTMKIKVVYNPLPEVPHLEKKLNNPTFMYLGGDSYAKGFHLFLKAAQEVSKQASNVKFLVAKDVRDSNKQVIEKLNAKFNKPYSLLGNLTHEEVLKLHAMSYALIFPSICEEPLPYAVVESMLAGTIPIASRVGGAPEIVKGTYAEKMLFTPSDADELVCKMESVLAMSNEQIINIGYELRESILKRFNPDVTKRALIETFSG